jgi:hypothetical protein
MVSRLRRREKMREQSNEVGDNKVGAPFYKVGGGGGGGR